MKKVSWIRARFAWVVAALVLAMTPAFAQKKTMTLWLIGDAQTGSYAQVYHQIEPALKEAFPDLEVDLHFVVGPHDRYLVSVAAGIAPDIVTMSTGQAPQFIEAGLLVPIDYEVFGVRDGDQLKDLFYPGALNSMYMYDDVYFMPTETTTFGMYYNLDLLQANGMDEGQVPRTWDELIETGRRFMRTQDGAITQTGLALRRGWMWPSFRFAALLRQAGTDWVVDGKAAFTSLEAQSAIEMYSSLFHENQITSAGADNLWFQNGNAAFYLGPSYEMRSMGEMTSFEFGTAAYPVIDPDRPVSTSYSYGMFVSSLSPNQKEAWEVVKFITDAQWAPTWYRTSALLIPRAGDWIMDIIADEPKFTPFILELEHARLEIAHPKYNDINGAIRDAENQIVARTASVGNILADLNQKVDVFLQQTGQ